MNDGMFTWAGRLTRRDYALIQGQLLGGASLVTFGAFSLLLPLVYLCAAAFFREASVAFWCLLIVGVFLLLIGVYSVLPLLAIPSTVRRLHDIGRSGWLSFPLVLASIGTLGILLVVLTGCLSAVESVLGISFLSSIFQTSSYDAGKVFGGLLFGYLMLCFFMFFLCSFYGAWIFLKKGTPGANRYGEPSAEESLPPVRAAYLSMQGVIDRQQFIGRSLILLAVAGILLPVLGQSVLYPVAAILGMVGLVPLGTDFFVLLLGSMIYPIAALPLVVRRLRTLGRSAWEVLLVFAALLPNLLCNAALARFLGRVELLDENTPDITVIEDFLRVGGTDDSILMTLWGLCAALSLVGIVRLLAADADAAGTRY